MLAPRLRLVRARSLRVRDRAEIKGSGMSVRDRSEIKGSGMRTTRVLLRFFVAVRRSFSPSWHFFKTRL